MTLLRKRAEMIPTEGRGRGRKKDEKRK